MRVMFGYLPLAPVTRTREPLGMTVSDMFLQYLKVGGSIYRDWISADYQYASFAGLVIAIGVVVDQHYEIQTCRSPNFIHGSPWLIQRLGGQLPGEWLLSLQANAT